MLEVIVRNPEDPSSFDRAMKAFKKMIEKANIIAEVNDRKFYLKPSEKKRKKERERERTIFNEKKEKE